MRPLPRVVALFLLGGLALAPAVHAADTPKQRTLYRDGPSGRYLLGGNWFLRMDPADQGVKLAYQKQKSAAGWSLTKVPKAVNAGDFSNASYFGTVAWFRKDFRVPSGSK